MKRKLNNLIIYWWINYCSLFRVVEFHDSCFVQSNELHKLSFDVMFSNQKLKLSLYKKSNCF